MSSTEEISRKYFYQKNKESVFPCFRRTFFNNYSHLIFKIINNSDKCASLGISDKHSCIVKMLKKKCKNFSFFDSSNLNIEAGAKQSSEKYDVIIDSGFLENGDQSDFSVSQAEIHATKIFENLRNKGRYILLTTFFNGYTKELIDIFRKFYYPVRIIKIHFEIPFDTETKEKLIGYLIIGFNSKQDFEKRSVCSYGETNVNSDHKEIMNQCINFDEISKYLFLDYNLIISLYLRHNFVSDIVRIILYKDDLPAYTLNIVDSDSPTFQLPYLIFIVSRGYENDWYFCDDSGLKELSLSVNSKRVIVVNLHPGQKSNDIEAIKKDLNGIALEFVPLHLKNSRENIPFATNVNEDFGSETIIFQESSQMSGEIIVSDIVTKLQKTRRLIFATMPSVIQSEVTLTYCSTSLAWKPEPSFVKVNYQKSILISLQSFLKENSENRILMIGLGGGCLASSIQKIFPTVSLDVVEIDPVLKKVAQNYFGLEEGPRFLLQIADGVEYFKDKSLEHKYDAIIIDTNNDNSSTGLSCPHPTFLTSETLNNISSFLSDNGYLIMNISCRNIKLYEDSISKLKKVFPKTITLPVEEDLNKIALSTSELNEDNIKRSLSNVKLNDNVIGEFLSVSDIQYYSEIITQLETL